MRVLLATAAVLVGIASAPAYAASTSLEALAHSLPDEAIAFTKKGGKGWGHHKGWKHRKAWKHAGRGHYYGGPPPWAPAWGLRRKRGW